VAAADVHGAAGRREEASSLFERAVDVHERKGNAAAAERVRVSLAELVA
jgi:hypothetical protein